MNFPALFRLLSTAGALPRKLGGAEGGGAMRARTRFLDKLEANRKLYGEPKNSGTRKFAKGNDSPRGYRVRGRIKSHIIRSFDGVRPGFEHLGRRSWSLHATKGWRHHRIPEGI